MPTSAQRQEPPALGKYANIASPVEAPAGDFSEARYNALVERFALQGGARHLLPADHRCQGCLRWRLPGVEDVEVWHIPEEMRARLGGVQTCASVWACPVCASKISERRKTELQAALDAAKLRGLVTVMLTTTVRHAYADELTALMAGLMEARRKGFSGKAWKTLRDRCGWVGSIRAVEVTFGVNGWHPHIHEIIFMDSDRHIGQFRRGFSALWSSGLARSGMRSVNGHGVNMVVADDDAASYVAKFGAAYELTKAVSKRGRKADSRTPMQLLAEFTFEGDIASGARWREYALGMHGRHQLQWSRGLRKLLLGQTTEKTDEELAAESDKRGTLMALIAHPAWQKILADGLVPQMLRVAGTGDLRALRDWLAPYTAPAVAAPDPFEVSPELLALAQQYPQCDEYELRDIMAFRRIRRGKAAEADLTLMEVDIAVLWHWHHRGDPGCTRELRRRLAASHV